MIDVWAALLAVTAGAIVGLCSAALYTVLQLPLRVMHACGAPMKRGLVAWALALGITGGTLMGSMRSARSWTCCPTRWTACAWDAR